MNHNEWSYAWVAIIVAFVVLRGLFRLIRGLGSGGGNQMDRMNAAAKRVLQDQKSGRSAVPLTQTMTQAQSQAKAQSEAPRSSRQTQQRQNAQNQPRKGVTKTARPLSTNRTPAVIRRGAGLLSGAREPVIQRRR